MTTVLRFRFTAALAMALLPLPGPVRAQSMTNVHVATGGAQANDHVDQNGQQSISDDGRYVTFASTASNLVVPDALGFVDVFVHDRTTGATVRVTTGFDGSLANGDSFRPSLSGNGRFVSFQSSASNLVTGDTNGMPDVFRFDRDADGNGVFDETGGVTMARASVKAGGGQIFGPSLCYVGSISDDGDVVAFECGSDTVVAGDLNEWRDCFVRVFSTGTTEIVSVTSTGGASNGHTDFPVVSGDGNVVAFTSGTFPDNLVPGDTNGFGDIFVRNRSATTTVRVSVTSGGAEANGASTMSAISDDGAVVAFETYASNLVTPDVGGFTDILARDLTAGTTTRVSRNTGGTQANQNSSRPSISGNGRVVSFDSFGSNLVTGDSNGAADVFAHDRTTGTTVRASRAVSGTQGNGQSLCSTVSQDGDFVAFSSAATNLVTTDTNARIDVFVRGEPFSGPGGVGPPPPTDSTRYALHTNPVSFSVSGPVDPHTEGIRFPRGGSMTPQAPPQPGNPYGFGIRSGDVPEAIGINSAMRPGDVADYFAIGYPSEAALFQSAPPTVFPFDGGPPDGTNNQIAEAFALGLTPGPDVATMFWATTPPMAMARDNVDAISFGEDHFPPTMFTGLAPDTFPDPPPAAGGDLAVVTSPSEARMSLYKEPIVVGDGAGASFRFSVDPWAVGAAGTGVAYESGGADVGAGLGPWTSAGEAAGDVFGTPILTRMAGATGGGGGNVLVDDNNALALAPDTLALDPMEDDLDALESEDATSDWSAPGPPMIRAGNVHGRLMHVIGAGLPPAGASWHDPVASTPIFFSVSRNSVGRGGSAVRSQAAIDGGAGADIFVAVKNMADPPGYGTNLLFIDEAEIGLMPTDDLDGLILWVCPEFRATIYSTIADIAASLPSRPPPPGPDSAYSGPGMMISITKYIGTIPPDCIRVGFSVTTDAIGLEYTAVDWEAAPISGPTTGVSSAAGDVFFARIDGGAASTNFLWHEEAALGLDPGSWVNGTSTSLAALADNLNALDSNDSAVTTTTTGVPPRGAHRELWLGRGEPNPFRHSTRIAFVMPDAGMAQLTVHDVAGRRVAMLADRFLEAGSHGVVWQGRSSDGAFVPAGIYFAMIRVGQESRVVKLVRIE